MVLYHTTPMENLDSIMADGLEARALNQPIYPGMYGSSELIDKGIYVTTRLDDARTYAEWLPAEKEHDGEMVIIEIDRSRSETLTDPDGDMFADHISATGKILPDSVPPDEIKVVEA